VDFAKDKTDWLKEKARKAADFASAARERIIVNPIKTAKSTVENTGNKVFKYLGEDRVKALNKKIDKIENAGRLGQSIAEARKNILIEEKDRLIKSTEVASGEHVGIAGFAKKLMHRTMIIKNILKPVAHYGRIAGFAAASGTAIVMGGTIAPIVAGGVAMFGRRGLVYIAKIGSELCKANINAKWGDENRGGEKGFKEKAYRGAVKQFGFVFGLAAGSYALERFLSAGVAEDLASGNFRRLLESMREAKDIVKDKAHDLSHKVFGGISDEERPNVNIQMMPEGRNYLNSVSPNAKDLNLPISHLNNQSVPELSPKDITSLDGYSADSSSKPTSPFASTTPLPSTQPKVTSPGIMQNPPPVPTVSTSIEMPPESIAGATKHDNSIVRIIRKQLIKERGLSFEKAQEKADKMAANAGYFDKTTDIRISGKGIGNVAFKVNGDEVQAFVREGNEWKELAKDKENPYTYTAKNENA
ncbi:MAG: hypothetical protein NTZ80_04135, partial [Patescibacteria group bacterium]|nr:hypothetical protein [Patescibacteria group bacterium]